ncbi:DoxX family protein [Crocinitomix algicola]|uniref:DoxX family protein n=1 Tax=Crocinitomix algicola TaxID=1740263 RepID=UPI00087211AE|nr:DoxX family protein [Crocinitomix algicola]
MTHKILHLISSLLMFFFGIMKVIGSEASRKGFEQFSPKIGIDPEFFMYFTGTLEVLVAVLLLVSIFELKKKVVVGVFAHLMLFGTMFGALITEIFFRDQAKLALVIIAIVLACIALYYLRYNILKFSKNERTG